MTDEEKKEPIVVVVKTIGRVVKAVTGLPCTACHATGSDGAGKPCTMCEGTGHT